MNAPRKSPPNYIKVWDFTPSTDTSQEGVLRTFRNKLEGLMTQDETDPDPEEDPLLRLQRVELQTNKTIRGLSEFIIWAANELATNAAKYTGALTVAETTVYSDEHGGFRGAELGYVSEQGKGPGTCDIILLIHDSSPDSAVGQPDQTRDSYETGGYGTVAVYQAIASDHGYITDESGKTVWVRFGTGDETLDA